MTKLNGALLLAFALSSPASASDTETTNRPVQDPAKQGVPQSEEIRQQPENSKEKKPSGLTYQCPPHLVIRCLA